VSALHLSVLVIWLAFWLYWLAAALRSKPTERTYRRGRGAIARLFAAGAVLIGLHFAGAGTAVHSPVVIAAGLCLLVAGLSFAIWARTGLGSNWGMPMTRRVEPELVTIGPYRWVRHPIYSGILLGVVGTALALDLNALLIAAVMAVYFLYAARAEERTMGEAFPASYPAYRARTKMLVPFVI
jgi:protein-S-isoprenylcysteine O-methyltransferase Ste14